MTARSLIQSDIAGGKDGSILWVLGADGSQTTLLHADADHWIGGASFTPDGSEVVYAFSASDSSQTGIFEVDARGGTPNLLREGRPAPDGTRFDLSWPAVSPDGSTIAYIDGGGDHDSLREMDADGSHVRILLPATGVLRGAMDGGLAWSPDGSRLAFGTGTPPTGSGS